MACSPPVSEAPPSYSESVYGSVVPPGNVSDRNSAYYVPGSIGFDDVRGSVGLDGVTLRSSVGLLDGATLRRPSEILPQPVPGQRLTFCDFFPSTQGIFTEAQDTFSTLLVRANNWLRSSPTWRVHKCETVKAWFDRKTQNYETQIYYDDDSKTCVYVIGIRLWLTTAQQDFGVSLVQSDVEVVHLVALSAPVTNRSGKPSLAFENVQQLLERFRKQWENQPVPGRFLSVDTRKTPLHNLQNFDPENVVFQREKHYKSNTLEVVRVFYEVGTPKREKLEIVDFLPVTTIPLLGSVQRESVSDVFKTASAWLKKHCWDSGNRLLNIQTLELDIRPGGKSDTARLWSSAEAKTEFYVRFLRASYVSGSSKSFQETCLPDFQSDLAPCVRTFIPVQVPGSTQSSLKLEHLQKSRERLEAWVKATGARILTVESVWLRSPYYEDVKKTSESSATVSSGNRYRWLSAVRLYLDKEYADPPAVMLPAMPKVDGLCSIS